MEIVSRVPAIQIASAFWRIVHHRKHSDAVRVRSDAFRLSSHSTMCGTCGRAFVLRVPRRCAQPFIITSRMIRAIGSHRILLIYEFASHSHCSEADPFNAPFQPFKSGTSKPRESFLKKKNGSDSESVVLVLAAEAIVSVNLLNESAFFENIADSSFQRNQEERKR